MLCCGSIVYHFPNVEKEPGHRTGEEMASQDWISSPQQQRGNQQQPSRPFVATANVFPSTFVPQIPIHEAREQAQRHQSFDMLSLYAPLDEPPMIVPGAPPSPMALSWNSADVSVFFQSRSYAGQDMASSQVSYLVQARPHSSGSLPRLFGTYGRAEHGGDDRDRVQGWRRRWKSHSYY